MVTRVTLALLTVFTWALNCCAQGASTPSTADVPNANGTNARVVRDPTTGKTYYQQWVTETVPVVRWENKQITTTSYETEWVNTVVPTTQTTYQPQTQQLPQAYWKGAWNPFQQPTLAYKYVPVTNWVPQTATVNQVVPRQQVVPKQQTITVPQPITETKTQQRLVQTEISQPAATLAASYPATGVGYTAKQPPALFNIPLLARQPFAPPAYQVPRTAAPTHSPNYAYNAAVGGGWTSPTVAGSGWSAPPQQSQFVAVSPNNGLRPVSKMLQSILPPASYSAPMNTATAQGGAWNVTQAGMQPTVLR